MKILVYGINFSPELTGIGKFTGEMCEWLAAKGHDVEVITAMPYYPQWQIDNAYKGKGWFSEKIHQVKVFRCPLYVPGKVTGKKRIIHELSFIISSLYFWIPRFFKNYDIVIAVSPTSQTALFPWFYKLLRRKPFLFHIQDLQVDAARKLGLIKNKFLLRILEWNEKFFLKRTTAISVISEGMKRKIIQKGIPEHKIFLFPNWVDTEFIKPLAGSSLKYQLGFKESDKIILYSGNIGEKQGLKDLIQAGEKLQDRKDTHIVICGNGVAKKNLENYVQKKNLRNILFLNVQPYEKLDELLDLADIHVVLQKKAASDLVFPSKLMSILSAGGFSIVTAEKDSDLYNFVTNNNLGIVIPPENDELLSKTLREFLSKENKEIRENARKFAIENLDKSKIMRAFETNLLRIIS